MTLASSLQFSGRGVHTGQKTSVTLQPAEEGISFHRTDVPGARIWPLETGNVSGLPGRSVVGRGEDAVQTPEHVLAALAGMGVDAAMIEVDGPEVPVLDGSALPFAQAIEEAGLVSVGRPSRVYRMFCRVEVRDGSAALSAEPYPGLSVSYRLEYEGFPSATGELTFEITPEEFLREIAPARTFVTEREAEGMLKAGLGKGADETNTVLIAPDGPAKGGPFRFPLEPVRHKILDLVGDVALLGGRLEAKVCAWRSGHSLNYRLLEKIAMSATLKPSGEPIRGGMDISGIEGLLPHRFPFLLIDRVIECEAEERLVAVKNVTRNEQFFEGHFPGRAVMPGVLQVEAMAQAAGILLMHYHPDPENMTAAIVGLDQVRFRRTVEPGDQLIITVYKEKVSRRLGVVRGVATVNGDVACEARLLFSVVPKNSASVGRSEE